MTRAICSTAAAAALMLVSMGAQAAVETLGFESFVDDVKATAKLGETPPRYGTPAAVGMLQGFRFSGAYAYAFTTAEPALDGALATPGGAPVGDGYIANRSLTSNPGPITLDLDPSGIGNFLLSLSFNVFVGGTAEAQVRFYSGTNTNPVFTSAAVPGDSNQLWSTTTALTATENQRVNRLIFDTTTTGGTFGLDNIRVEFFQGSGGTVPEPASYALVALALLGAGAATRRRKA